MSIMYPESFPSSVREIIDWWMGPCRFRRFKSVEITQLSKDDCFFLVQFTIKARLFAESPVFSDPNSINFSEWLFNNDDFNHPDAEPFDLMLSKPLIIANDSSHHPFLDNDVNMYLSRLDYDFEYLFDSSEKAIGYYLDEACEG